MKKINIVFAVVLLLSSVLITNTYGQERKGPPKSDKKGPPPGGGHSPEQTESQTEMKGYKIGDTATDFELKNVDGKMFSLASIKDAKGYIVVFTCNECPFAKMYEDRLIELHNNYAV